MAPLPRSESIGSLALSKFAGEECQHPPMKFLFPISPRSMRVTFLPSEAESPSESKADNTTTDDVNIILVCSFIKDYLRLFGAVL